MPLAWCGVGGGGSGDAGDGGSGGVWMQAVETGIWGGVGDGGNQGLKSRPEVVDTVAR